MLSSSSSSSSSASTLNQNSESGESPYETAEREKQNRQRIVLTIIDVGGHILYSGLWPSVAKAADALMFVYDVADRRSFDAIWGFYKTVSESKECKPGDIPTVLVGNMVDTVGK
jgi:GTPase SAR1 family protein